ncbi:uncharacterized protein RAG0_01740 [Rhynchosporium agropyri]|uniref:Uncharacterized protein n=1 Tax=Rhynchosporium agropyri TaxID=914238 RepID=A0A1E1JYF8_9HELO|nr:uncharacterized protein RAG0_01740 [Rhynchosporium agropyri]
MLPIASSDDEDCPFITSKKTHETDPVLSPTHTSKSLTFVHTLAIISALLSPVLLILLALNIYYNSFRHIHDDDAFTRAIFGDLPFTAHPFGSSGHDFFHSDPYDGQASALYHGKPFNASQKRTPWDDIYPSDHLAIETPERFGLWGGLDLSNEGKNKDEWTGQMGFNVGILHQLHCVGILKHTVMTYNRTEESPRLTEFEIYHANHCVEVLREVRLPFLPLF